jgi:hypothetical protein
MNQSRREETYLGRNIVAQTDETPGGWSWSFVIDGGAQGASKVRLLPDPETALLQALFIARSRIDDMGRGE